MNADDETEQFRISITPDVCTLWANEEELFEKELKKFGEDSYGYNVIQIESQPGYWRIVIDSQLLGEIPKPNNDLISSSIRLSAKGLGWAHFEQVRFRQFDSSARTEIKVETDGSDR